MPKLGYYVNLIDVIITDKALNLCVPAEDDKLCYTVANSEDYTQRYKRSDCGKTEPRRGFSSWSGEKTKTPGRPQAADRPQPVTKLF